MIIYFVLRLKIDCKILVEPKFTSQSNSIFKIENQIEILLKKSHHSFFREKKHT